MHPFFPVFEEWLSNRATGLSVLKSIEGYLAQVVQGPSIPDQAVLDRLQALVRTRGSTWMGAGVGGHVL